MGIHGLLLCAHLASYVYGTSFSTGNLSCYVNYVTTMHCTWSKGEFLGEGPYSLFVISDYIDFVYNYTCKLCAKSDVENEYSCSFDIEEMFNENDMYTIYLQTPVSVNGNAVFSTTLLMSEFEPFANIQFDPPYNLWSSFLDNKYRIAWNMSDVLQDGMIYQMQLKKESLPWEKTGRIFTIDNDHYLEIEPSDLELNSVYVVRLRCKTRQGYHSYQSQWSGWSSELQIQTSYLVQSVVNGNKSSLSNHIISLLVTMIITLIILYLFFSFKVPARVKIMLLKNVPTAAEFFQPLYDDHKGNFQNWTKYPQKKPPDQEGQSTEDKADVDILSTTVLDIPKETISSVERLEPLSAEDIPVAEYSCVLPFLSNALLERNILVHEIVFPNVLPGSTDYVFGDFSFKANYVSHNAKDFNFMQVK
ncbi:interleukin-9 receptor-like [Xenopus laevis]|uniref:Interleukin-9 receptor-like n=2 Tax=Xenopus laevis TaxID=8355 RepID=A0A1L8EQ93_XENLA|nr:interleukin-9 receptor-like [Xenopus laevis]OCT61538.1 hypothetical protein XELAEV_18047565mg [Xenopus laevis]